MMSRGVQSPLELRASELAHHGMAKQQEALLSSAQMNDYSCEEAEPVEAVT